MWHKTRLTAALDAVPPAISFIMGAPSRQMVDTAHERSIVVASGSDAGGHRGAFLGPAEESLVGTSSLVPRVSGQAARLARRRTAADCVRDRVEQTSATLQRVAR
jgi:hypothetical protein